MNEHSHNKENSSIWTIILTSAGVALLVSALVTIGLNIPVFLAQRTIPMPNLIGMNVQKAETFSSKYKFVILPVDEKASDKEEGVILSHKPKTGEPVKPGQVVKVVLSRGRPMVNVPNLTGVNLLKASDMLQAAGLFVEDVVSKNDTLAEDLIVETNPAAGTDVEKGSKVTLTVSLGPDLVEVPKLTGKRLSQVKRILKENGFELGKVKYQVSSEYYQNTVMKQTPAKGSMAPAGSAIDLVVASVLK